MLAHNLTTARPGLTIHQGLATEAATATKEAFQSQEGASSSHTACLLEGSYLDALADLRQDVVFLDPPWPGTDGSYKGLGKLTSDAITLGGVAMPELCRLLLASARYLVWKLPCTFDVDEFAGRIEGWKLRSPIRWKGQSIYSTYVHIW